MTDLLSPLGPLTAADLLAGMTEPNDVLHDPARLAAVHRLVLQSPDTEELVADLLRAAARLLEADTAMLNVVLDDMHLIVAAHGLSGWLEAARALPAEWSFCARTVRTGLPYVLPDAAEAPEQAGNPLVEVDGIRAYAGAPLQTSGGEVLGALCVAGGAPRPFSAAQLAALQGLAAEAVRRLEERAGHAAGSPTST